MPPHQAPIGPNTQLTLTTVISILCATVWLTNELREIKTELVTQRAALASKVSIDELRVWISTLKSENPALVVPPLR